MKRKTLFIALILVGGMLLGACVGMPPAIVLDLPLTPIPTLIPATLPPPDLAAEAAGPPPCAVAAMDLMGTWANAGAPETEPFDFTDVNTGETCQGTFAADVLPLFTESNLWFTGAHACSSCHGPDLEASDGQMDLSTYAGIMAGSHRTSADAAGDDIMGGGVWEESIMYTQLSTGEMPQGRPEGLAVDAGLPVVLAGTAK